MILRIAGAGLAGLLAGNMLAHRKPEIYEIQPVLPNNHSAVLRFRTPIIGDVLSIPFRKVQLIKSWLEWKNPVADALAYSRKNGGKLRSDRSFNAGLVTGDRYIAPPDLIQRMAEPLTIHFDRPAPIEDAPLISTLPMPNLMALLAYPGYTSIEFYHIPGVNYKAKIKDCDAYISLLVPDPLCPFSRISITADEMIVESPGVNAPAHLTLGVAQGQIHHAAALLGIPKDQTYDLSAHPQKYAKIQPIHEDARRDFIYWATDRYNIFSLGRFATWRPGLLLDDLVKDIRLIDGWLDRKDRYAVANYRR